MALKFRRGTNAQQSGSLVFGEPYINTDLNTLLIGGNSTQIQLLNISGGISSSLLPLTGSTFDLGSPTKFWRDLYISTASIKFVDGAGNIVGTLSSNANGDLNITGALSASAITGFGNATSYSSSVSTRLVTVESVSASSATALNSFSASNATTNNTQTTNITTATQAAAGAFASASAYSASAATIDNAQDVLISSLRTNILSASVFTTFSTSVDSRLDTVELVSASAASTYAKLNSSNTFNGTQIISGSLYVTQDFIVGGSASIQNITSSQLNIGDNIITVNTINPNVRFGGMAVIDSGSSPLVSGSILYDSVQDEWVFVHKGDGTNVTSSHFVMGPETFNNLGNETYLTNNRIPKGKGNEHLNDSNITDDGTTITLGSNTSVTGTIVSTGTTLVSGSAQITISSTTGYSTFSSSIASTDATQTTNINAASSSAAGAFASASAYSASAATVDAGQDTLISSLRTNILSASVFTTFSTSVDSRLDTVELVSASAASALNSFSASNATTDNTQTTNITTATQAAAGAFASASLYSSSFATTIGNLGSTYATDAELSSVSGAFATSQASQDTLISSLRTNILSASVFTTFSTSVDSRLDTVELVSASAASALNSVSGAIATRDANQDSVVSTLSSSVNTRLVTLEGKDFTISLTGDVTGTGTVTDLGNVSFATTIAANSVALGTDTTGNYMSDLTQGTGVTITHTPGEGSNATIAIGQSVATSATPSFDQVFATNNGNGTNFKVGDDAWIGDVNVANTIKIKGQQDATAGYISFGNQTTQLGLVNSTTLTWGASFTATGDVTAYSDRRVKENIQTIDGALDKVLKLRGVTYNRIDTEDKSEKIGVIAQEIKEVLPQVVHDEGDKLSVAYGNLAGIFIEAIKEQQIQIHNLTLEIEKLKESKGL